MKGYSKGGNSWPWSEPFTRYENLEKSWFPYPKVQPLHRQGSSNKKHTPWQAVLGEGWRAPAASAFWMGYTACQQTYACGDCLKPKLRDDRHWHGSRQHHELPLWLRANMSLLSSNLSIGRVLVQDAGWAKSQDFGQ